MVPEIMFMDKDVVVEDVVILVKTIFMVDTIIFGRGQPFGRGHSYNRDHGRNYNHVPQGNRNQPHNNHDGLSHSENPGGSFYICGSKDHWSRTCRIPPHLCQIYKESLKGKEKKEVNLVDNLKLDNLELPNTDLNVSDFFNDVVL
ncbi:hypothetical protein OSB04_019412 [Centaurea solstitialis]|uniref:CCHC-type domain-containing protein n=1 Tax=Centaurea solstitialis TaxID=347529 RepID=A0AA38SQA3_9ASTR|nr:hypothetical protein OSB04_019412 [Centaurea solstitialis]